MINWIVINMTISYCLTMCRVTSSLSQHVLKMSASSTNAGVQTLMPLTLSSCTWAYVCYYHLHLYSDCTIKMLLSSVICLFINSWTLRQRHEIFMMLCNGQFSTQENSRVPVHWQIWWWNGDLAKFLDNPTAAFGCLLNLSYIPVLIAVRWSVGR